MIEVECTYYAMMRERCGRSSEVVQTEAATPVELYQQVAATHGFPSQRDHLKVAINDQFVNWSTALRSGDRISFIPPVAGGCGHV